ncbi:tRNA pseudouridine synthase D TruD [Methanococcus vannielii SB]|uniref:Probable tRNA pseudouridine synthase D n=2 Tax=Methanococcus vannielii TaxID=2187 RepID=TRUD_METVS|nr:RecName: Full=Probable tRNA pseudouridine synthase D; AltName: Full=tRNA pseudouridine(13) synthase; AltName: Full=tRNA pseudouridylate synthase D; AltName: Full=tRNA-uridine isomerase D [Methanococcus vannielii SB]ABR55382.1 tRNA pseudouridine synthase D TruD [Methanococcus vannielii SB]
MPLNIEKYILKTNRFGGTLKKYPEDFIVEEIMPDGTVLEVGKEIDFLDETPWNGSFIHFTLEKRNWNTMDALSAIVRATKTKRKNFGFAGTKDKFAVTTQRMGCFGLKKEQLESVKIPEIIIKDIQKSNKKLRMGDLFGNRFTINIRDIEKKYMELENLSDLKLDHVLNYFGIQRFGLKRPITHIVGKFIYERDFESAFYTYCGTPISETGDEKEARELVDSGNFKGALKLFSKGNEYEKRLIQQYFKYKDFKMAFTALPPQLNSMFVNAYQAYLFNEMVNERYNFGFEPLTGDILEDNIPTGALIGYNTEFGKGIQGEIEKEIFNRENIDLKKFKIEDFGNFYGTRRKLITPVYDFKSEFKEKVLTLSFKLERGNYATIVTREFTGNLG